MSSLGITPRTAAAGNSSTGNTDDHPWESFGYARMMDDNDTSRSTSIETSTTTTTTSSSHPSTSTTPRRYSLSSSLSPTHAMTTTSSLQPLDHCQTSRSMIHKDSISLSSSRQQHRSRRRSPPPPPVITNGDYFNLQQKNIYSPLPRSPPLSSPPSPYHRTNDNETHSLSTRHSQHTTRSLSQPSTPSPRHTINRRPQSLSSSPDDADKAAGCGTTSVVSSPSPNSNPPLHSPTTPRRSNSIAPSLADRIRCFEKSSPRSTSTDARRPNKTDAKDVSSPRSPPVKRTSETSLRRTMDVRVDDSAPDDEERDYQQNQRPPPSPRVTSSWKESPPSGAAGSTTRIDLSKSAAVATRMEVTERDDGRDDEEGGAGASRGEARREQCVKLSTNQHTSPLPSPRDPAPPPRRRHHSLPTSPKTNPPPPSTSVVAAVLSQLEPQRLKSPRKEGQPSVAAMAKLFTKNEVPRRRPSSTVAHCRSVFEGGDGIKAPVKRWTREESRRSTVGQGGSSSVVRRSRSASLPRLSTSGAGDYNGASSPRKSKTTTNTPVGGGRHWESPRSMLPPRQQQPPPPPPPMLPRRAPLDGNVAPTTQQQQQQQRPATTAAVETTRLPHVISVDSQSDGFDSCSSVSSSSFK